MFFFFSKAFEVAVSNWKADLLDKVFEKFGEVDIKSDVDLMMSAMTKSAALVTRLIEAGADVNAKSEDGFTVLMSACDRGNHEVVEVLLDNGADIDAVCEAEYANALYLALGYEKVLTLLLDRGAKCAVTDPENETVAHHAAAQGWTHCLKKMDPDFVKLRSPDQWSVWHFASMSGMLETVEWIESIGITPEPNLEEALWRNFTDKVCTYRTTHAEYLFQPYRPCETCIRLGGSVGPVVCVCVVCAEECKELGHKLGELKFGDFFCDKRKL